MHNWFAGKMFSMNILLFALSVYPFAFIESTLSASEDVAINVLVFSKTTGYRHESISDGQKAILELATKEGYSVAFTENASWFSDEILKNFDVVIFLNTTGDVLNPSQERSFESFIRRGGGFIGIHSASDTEYEWKFYERLVGTYFKIHPEIQEADVHIEDPSHPTMSALPKVWRRKDEWYNFRANPRGKVHVLATVNEASYRGGEMGNDHPIIWCQDFEGGRSWYCAMGHTKETFHEPLYMDMIRRAILWAARKI